MDRYVVIGNPIAHSRSPEIHARFARETGEAMAYERMRVEPGDFARAAAAFFAGGGRGANVTLPFKLDAYAFAQEHTARAREAGAVNTLALRDGTVLGDNTDGARLARARRVLLREGVGVELEGERHVGAAPASGEERGRG
ncbi:MAG: shikimate dehydrogenase, partial [Burkholderiales bacterium]|nr:shikimate dehydrogenase [Burkholderiales bacterium]